MKVGRFFLCFYLGNYMKKIFIYLFIIFSQQAPLFTYSNDELAYINLEDKKGWIISEDLQYTSDIGEETDFRWLRNNFLLWCVFNDTLSMQIDVPLEFYYYGVRDEGQEALNLFLINNINIYARCSFDWIDYRWQLFLGLETPTSGKISGSYAVSSNQIDEQRFWAVEPGMVISRVYYPMLLFLKLSFSQPIYREYDSIGVFSLWKAQFDGGFDFILNNSISCFTNLSIIETEIKATFIIQAGFAQSLGPQLVCRIYLSNEYSGYIKQSFIGLSFYYSKVE